MIGYVTLGTNDLPRAAAFYDALLAEVGVKRLMDFGRGYAWGSSMGRPMLGIMKPYDGQPATGSFYAAYFRDLDGNKLNCFCTG